MLNNFSGLILEIPFCIGILYQTKRTAKQRTFAKNKQILSSVNIYTWQDSWMQLNHGYDRVYSTFQRQNNFP